MDPIRDYLLNYVQLWKTFLTHATSSIHPSWDARIKILSTAKGVIYTLHTTEASIKPRCRSKQKASSVLAHILRKANVQVRTDAGPKETFANHQCIHLHRRYKHNNSPMWPIHESRCAYRSNLRWIGGRENSVYTWNTLTFYLDSDSQGTHFSDKQSKRLEACPLRIEKLPAEGSNEWRQQATPSTNHPHCPPKHCQWSRAIYHILICLAL